MMQGIGDHVQDASDAQRRVKSPVRKGLTYDCALLEPLALPPDLPPVILDVMWVRKV